MRSSSGIASSGTRGAPSRRLLASAIAVSGLVGGTAMAARERPPSPLKAAAAAQRAAERADALVRRMTLAEKVSLVSTDFPAFSKRAKALGMTPSAGFNPGVPRLGIPPLRETDASLGVANQMNRRTGDTATALPSALATAATFDPQLAYDGGRMIGAEARAKTFNVLLAGGINLTRDPWAGRNFEYLGEDPLLSGVLGGAAVDGVQSNAIAATVKHFVLNAQETGRMVMDARIDPAALRESDLLAFEIALERGRPASVMCAYNRVNGDHACENDALLNGVLKNDWTFPGWVMSDWGAVHSTEKAALAGLDQESGLELDAILNRGPFFTDRLAAAVAAGRVPQARLDDMVRRILTGMIASGAMDRPVPATPQPIDAEAGAAVAQRVAEAGIVLLRNEGRILPLAATARRIAVIGGHADVGVLSGGGSSQVRSTGGAPIETPVDRGPAATFARQTYHASSPLRAIRALAPQAQVSFHDGADLAAAAAAAKASDVAIVFATQWQTEAVDAASLSLPEGQDALVAAVAAANPRTIVVLETGGPVLMPWLDRVPAVLAAWYPGQRGGQAIARILFGQVNPSGRLPLTFPASAEQAPRPRPAAPPSRTAGAAGPSAAGLTVGLAPFAVDYPEGANVGYRWFEWKKHRPLFPFGFGLSYTDYRLGGLRVSGGERPSASLDVTNVGDRPGVETVQVYVRARDSGGVPSWRLAGFGKVRLAAGQTRRLSVPLEPRTYSRWDDAAKRWRTPEGPLPVMVGRSAIDPVLTGEIPVTRAARRHSRKD